MARLDFDQVAQDIRDHLITQLSTDYEIALEPERAVDQMPNHVAIDVLFFRASRDADAEELGTYTWECEFVVYIDCFRESARESDKLANQLAAEVEYQCQPAQYGNPPFDNSDIESCRPSGIDKDPFEPGGVSVTLGISLYNV